ncbi:carbonic anhydrase 1-like, partial [Diadema antillarum]|uniref:carbonic anhydrase 1-like n=1 Tax=Diadema antillarum TaxID=105358 RepID=UPI003A8C7BFB
WTYTAGPYGPDNWGKLNGSICDGQRQSPIDIVTSNVINQDLGIFQLDGYTDVNPNMDISNGGHGVTISLGPAHTYNLSGASLPSTYSAAQFHFHWGLVNSRGSEHTLDGNSYPAELHMVHYDPQYGDLVAALTSGNFDAVTVLGFFIELGNETNTAFENFMAYFGNVSMAGQSLGTGNLPSFNLRSIMPFDLTGFWRYNGSLTVPNCYETVIWNVFHSPIVISTSQLERFRELYSDQPGPNNTFIRTFDNHRPVNPIYGRTVLHSEPGIDTVTTEGPTEPAGDFATALSPMMALFLTLCAVATILSGLQILVPLRHRHTNAKPKFITAMDRCFNARHRSSNPVSARKTLTTAPPKFVQRLITARAKLAKQRWSSVQDFCVGLADPSVHELGSSGAKL